jgi:hypothetical protein
MIMIIGSRAAPRRAPRRCAGRRRLAGQYADGADALQAAVDVLKSLEPAAVRSARAAVRRQPHWRTAAVHRGEADLAIAMGLEKTCDQLPSRNRRLLWCSVMHFAFAQLRRVRGRTFALSGTARTVNTCTSLDRPVSRRRSIADHLLLHPGAAHAPSGHLTQSGASFVERRLNSKGTIYIYICIISRLLRTQRRKEHDAGS